MNNQDTPEPVADQPKKKRKDRGIKCPFCAKGYITFTHFGDEMLVTCSAGCPSSFIRD